MKRLTTLNPTQSQKKVLAIILSNKEAPHKAYYALNGDLNLVGAKNILINLHAINVIDNQITLTDIGQQLAIDIGIVDDSGNLTNVGNSLLSNNSQSDSNPVNIQPSTDEAPIDDFPMESLSLLFKQLFLLS